MSASFCSHGTQTVEAGANQPGGRPDQSQESCKKAAGERPGLLR
jgi:hypothetical protein